MMLFVSHAKGGTTGLLWHAIGTNGRITGARSTSSKINGSQGDQDQWHRDLRRVVRGVDLFEEFGDGISLPDFSRNGIYSTDLFANAAMETIGSHNSSKPFFLFLSFQAVHPPLQVPKRLEKYCSTIKSKSRRIYCGMLTAMDFAIGRVIDLLKSVGYYEDTVIVFTSDNGGTAQFGASNKPLRGEKDTLWEGGTKTTTIVHAPKFIKMNGVRPQLFHVVDWHATLLAIGGMQLHSYGDGINQWDYIVTGSPRVRRFQFIYNIDDHGSAIRDGDYKLIYGNTDRRLRGEHGKIRLYRVTEDPGERNDISRFQPGVTRRLLNKILDLQKYMRRNVRKPLSLLGNPERLNGSYASGWCI
ncbi:hypothetical protein RB195_001945 [Necator americanus]|uniref:Sulfatase N-terminal domain-containing protein n=1 Tax=Necator americanus TaxID=51031 RepID=A0ABR1DGP0_NECAM